MTTAVTELQQTLSTAEGQKAYVEWIGHPITLMMLAASREMARPRYVDASGVAVAYGESIGAHRILDFFLNPTGPLGLDGARGVLPPARYGANNKGDSEA